MTEQQGSRCHGSLIARWCNETSNVVQMKQIGPGADKTNTIYLQLDAIRCMRVLAILTD